VNADNPLGYRMVYRERTRYSWWFWPAPPEANPFVQLFIEVDDVEACITQSTSIGGGVIIPPQKLLVEAWRCCAIRKNAVAIYRPA
jgi:hypothetical protein